MTDLAPVADEVTPEQHKRLLPALAGGVLPGSEGWRRLLLRPGEHPLEELRRVLVSGASDPLAEALDTLPANARLLLAVDQLEELFTACRSDAERAAFAAMLARAATDPAGRAIGGASSGAICAFTVAWHRPDQFRNVISFIGSYTSIGYRPAAGGQPMVPGGDLYPTLIRKTPIKPIRIFLQDGSADLDNVHGSWFLANQQMLAALEFANRNADAKKAPGPRYEVRHEWGDGAHSDAHGGAILPDVLRWIWGK